MPKYCHSQRFTPNGYLVLLFRIILYLLCQFWSFWMILFCKFFFFNFLFRLCWDFLNFPFFFFPILDTFFLWWWWRCCWSIPKRPTLVQAWDWVWTWNWVKNNKVTNIFESRFKAANPNSIVQGPDSWYLTITNAPSCDNTSRGLACLWADSQAC